MLFLVFWTLVVAGLPQTVGILQGTVTDPSGAVVVKAAVAITIDDAGQVRSTVTDKFGRYSIGDLPLAPFSLRVTSGLVQELTLGGRENFLCGSR